MPKQPWNILNFEGGFNKKTNKRDIDPSESVDLDGLISFDGKSLTTKGSFRQVDLANQGAGAFNDTYSNEGIPNLYSINPEQSFVVLGFAQVTAESGDIITLSQGTRDSRTLHHGLAPGTEFRIISIQSGSESSTANLYGIVTEFSTNQIFKADIEDGGAQLAVNDYILYAVNIQNEGTSNTDVTAYGTGVAIPRTSVDDNRFLLQAQQYGKFGFWSIGNNRYWYGDSTEEGNRFGSDTWYFDTQHLWDCNQSGSKNNLENVIGATPVYNLDYDNGAIRAALKAPTYYQNGMIKRPIGLYSMPEVKRHFSADREYRIMAGWYPLRQHCLAPHQYAHAPEFNSDLSVQSGWGGTMLAAQTYSTLSTFDSNTGDPTGYTEVGGAVKTHQIALAVGHNSNGKSGDWQFASGEEHSKLGFGISFLYDNIDQPLESNISLLNREDTSSSTKYVDMTSSSASNDQALYVYWKFSRGNVLTGYDNTQNHGMMVYKNSNLTNNNNVEIAVDQFRGSNTPYGASNYEAWNPRIVGANLYVTYNNDGPIDDPLWLGTIDFSMENKSISHDDSESAGWASATTSSVVHDGWITGISSVPVLTYRLKNGYKHNECINAWYKTSAIVNRRLYAGNVQYFKDEGQSGGTTESLGLTNDDYITELQKNTDTRPVSYPDRILRSEVNKLDILPESSFLDIVKHDGQDIVKLMGIGQKLLVFKHDDMYVIDCSGEVEFVEGVHKGHGIRSGAAVCQTPNAVYWLNANGLYGYDGQNPPLNATTLKISQEEWTSKIWNLYSHLQYNPQDNLIMVFSRYDGNPDTNDEASHLLIFDIDKSAFFYKSYPSEVSYQRATAAILLNNKLHIATSGSGSDTEQATVEVATAHVAPTKARFAYRFNTTSGGVEGSLGSSVKLALVKSSATSPQPIELQAQDSTTNSWIVEPDGNQPLSQRAQLWCNHFNTQTNHPESSQGYFNTLSYEVDSAASKIYYVYEGIAKEEGAAYSVEDFDFTGIANAAQFGSTSGMCFTDHNGTTVNDANDYGITEFSKIFNTAGTNLTQGVWRIYVNRADSLKVGVEYGFNLRYATENSENDEYSIYDATAKYITSSGTDKPYPDIGATHMSTYGLDDWQDECAWGINNLTASNRLINNIMLFLIGSTLSSSEPGVGTGISFFNSFTFSSLTTDSDGSVTGLSDLKYFTLTIKENSQYALFSDLDVSTHVSSGIGGKLLKWDTTTSPGNNRIILETKDIDFEQPNVRKKIYKAYITYKDGDGRILCQYQDNQDGTWSNATVTYDDGTATSAAGYLNDSATLKRATLKFGSEANNVYSFALRFKSETGQHPQDFEISDLTIIYRIKNVK